jgi:hypothetical protein
MTYALLEELPIHPQMAQITQILIPSQSSLMS